MFPINLFEKRRSTKQKGKPMEPDETEEVPEDETPDTPAEDE
jgi:hypothetical protein